MARVKTLKRRRSPSAILKMDATRLNEWLIVLDCLDDTFNDPEYAARLLEELASRRPTGFVPSQIAGVYIKVAQTLAENLAAAAAECAIRDPQRCTSVE